MPPELAPFIAAARARLERATEGLEHEAAVAHLREAVARAEVEASRLGMRMPDPPAEERLRLLTGDAPVVVIHPQGDPTQPE